MANHPRRPRCIAVIDDRRLRHGQVRSSGAAVLKMPLLGIDAWGSCIRYRGVVRSSAHRLAECRRSLLAAADAAQRSRVRVGLAVID